MEEQTRTYKSRNILRQKNVMLAFRGNILNLQFLLFTSSDSPTLDMFSSEM